jgi:hypothetical protein
MSALLLAYNPATNLMVRNVVSDVDANEAIDLWRSQGLDVSVLWLRTDPPPTVEELLEGLERKE